jgi:membrane protein implicated in regulation of membrane protease activity
MLVDAVFWVIAGIVLLFAEGVVPRQFFWSAGMSALLAAAVRLTGVESLELQVLVFVVSCGILLVLTRTAAGKYFQLASPHLRMNADAIPGQRATALTDLVLGAGAGRVRLRAMEWLAEPVDDQVIPAGSRVRIIAINGTTLVVRAEEG